MISYPTNFPQPSTTLSGDSETPVVRTDLDNGLVEQFGRFATGRETYNLQWTLSNAEFVIFEEWFNQTLVGGVLIFGLTLPDAGAYSVQPVRFVGGTYSTSHKSALWWTVTARVEKMFVTVAPTNRTLPIPQWLRLAVDPTISQNLTLAHRNAILTVRPGVGSQTTLRIYPPTDPTQYIYFGINNQGLGETLITSEAVAPIPSEAVPSWPALPGVNQAFRLDAKRNAHRLEMDSGHTRQFADADFTVKGYEVEWDFTLAQLQTFQDFFFVTLKSGSLIFWLTLPVDGQFIPVRVRFVGGVYQESYIFHNTFRVSATLDRIVDQTVTPPEDRPYPVFYSPTVNVTVNRKIAAGDAGKLFVVNPAAGQTISLHIYAQLIEFGLLIVGTGNVLITRGPFLVNLGSLADTGTGAFKPVTFELRDTIRVLGTLEADTAGGVFGPVIFELKSFIRGIGTLEADTAAGSFSSAKFELITTLEDIGTLDPDTSAGVFSPVTFELINFP